MHAVAERLKEKYGHFVDIDALWQQVMDSRTFFSINSAFFREAFLEPLFKELEGKLAATAARVDEPEWAFPYPIVDNVPQTNYENLMHTCSRCERAGRPARNIRSRYTFFSGDEAGVEKLSCMTCGNTWAR